MNDRATAPLLDEHRFLLIALMLIIGAFYLVCQYRGGVPEDRAAQGDRRMTDADCFLRGAWAVRAGQDPYTVVDDNGWHYAYPPLLAILLEPLGDPPKGIDRTGYLDYPLSHAIWLAICFATVFLASHLFARALEKTSLDRSVRQQPRFCQRWWSIRIWPIIFLMPAIGRSLSRGQVSTLWLLLMAGAAAAVLRGVPWRTGLYLAGAICLKIIPGFLLLIPLWRRQWTFFFWCVNGIIVGLLVIPAIAMGPQKMVDGYVSLKTQVLEAAFKGDTSGNRGRELTGVNSTDSNAFVVVIHHILNPIPDHRPEQAAPAVRAAHWLIAIALTVTTLWAAGWNYLPSAGPSDFEKRHPGIARREPQYAQTPEWELFTRRVDVLFLSAMMLVMIMISPVFHPHYFCLGLMPVMFLMWLEWERNGYEKTRLRYTVLFWSLFACHALTAAGIWFFRDFGLVLAGTLALWVFLLLEIRQLRREFVAWIPQAAKPA